MGHCLLLSLESRLRLLARRSRQPQANKASATDVCERSRRGIGWPDTSVSFAVLACEVGHVAGTPVFFNRSDHVAYLVAPSDEIVRWNRPAKLLHGCKHLIATFCRKV